MSGAANAWRDLDPSGPPRFVWLREVASSRCVVLLGAFDPPTKAHVAVLEAAARHKRVPGALCTTKVLLDRPPDELLPPSTRLELLDALGAEHGFGVGICNRGTYLEVARAMAACGAEPSFVIGSDKIGPLSDPSFYSDGRRGVEATFGEVSFLVVPRPGVPSGRFEVIDAPGDPAIRSISASQVRERLRKGDSVDDLVPSVVALALEGYTRATDS